MNRRMSVRRLLAVAVPLAVTAAVIAGCGTKNVGVPENYKYAYFDGKITFGDTANIFTDRANFVQFIVTGESRDKLAPVFESIDASDSARTRWVEFYGTTALKDTVLGYDMEMYITVDSLLGFSADTTVQRTMEVIAGPYEAELDTMKFQLRILPNYTYILNEFNYGKSLTVSKVGKWMRTSPYSLLLTEDEADYISTVEDYSSLMTDRKDSLSHKTMRFEYDPESMTLIEQKTKTVVFWRVFM